MKGKLSLFLTALLIAAIYTTPAVKAQEDQAQMKAWQDYMTPGPQHEMMAKMTGDWKANGKMWMAPGTDPAEFEGKAHFEMLLGGRYLSSKYDAEMMGMPFTGMQLDAYDNAKKEYITVWIDNMGTGVMVLKGKFDKKTNSITYTGSSVNPMTGSDEKVKTVLKFIDDNNYTFEMFMINGDQEFKSMEMVYKRI